MNEDLTGSIIEVMPRRMLIAYATKAGLRKTSTRSNESLLYELAKQGYIHNHIFELENKNDQRYQELVKEPPLYWFTKKGEKLFNEFVGYERFALEPEKEYPMITERSSEPQPKQPDPTCAIFLTIQQTFTESLFKEMEKYGVPFEIVHLTFMDVGTDNMSVNATAKFISNVYRTTSVGNDTDKQVILSTQKTDQEIILYMEKKITEPDWKIVSHTEQSVYKPDNKISGYPF